MSDRSPKAGLDDVSGRPFGLYDVISPGTTVMVRTITNYYLGVVTDSDERWVALRPAVWVADTGRLGEALRSGTLSEYEELPNGIVVMLGAVTDMVPWRHAVPEGDK